MDVPAKLSRASEAWPSDVHVNRVAGGPLRPVEWRWTECVLLRSCLACARDGHSESRVHCFAELEAGSTVDLAELPKRIPHLCYATELHVRISERFAQRANLAEPAHQVYVNYLATRSNLVRQTTALAFLLSTGQLSVRSITSDFIGPDFADLLGGEFEIHLLKPVRTNLIHDSQFRWFAMRVLSHKLFRLLGKWKKIKCTKLIRAHFDLIEKAYPQLIEQVPIFIYPFKTNVFRQRRFLAKCRRLKRSFSHAGFPYRFLDVLRTWRFWNQRDKVLVDAEVRAMVLHAKEITDRGVKEIFVSDEREMGGWVLHEELRKRGVRSTNTFHGIGVYGPYMSYHHLQAYTDPQIDYCRLRGRFGSHAYHPVRAAARSWSIPRHDPYRPMIVYVQSNWRQAGKQYEEHFENQAIATAIQISRELEFPFYIKVHPSTKRRLQQRTKRMFNTEMIANMDEVTGHAPIFLNTLSTAYFDLLSLGPTIFMADDLIDPELVFGKVPSVKLDRLPAVLACFRDELHWRQVLQQQQQVERAIAAGELRGPGEMEPSARS